jgi:hypothetical protein
MKNIIQFATLELRNENLKEEWKKMSDKISSDLQNVDGFISRDSAYGEDGKIYCILKWESKEKAEAMKKVLESEEFKGAMAAFAEIVNMETMKSETLNVI